MTRTAAIDLSEAVPGDRLATLGRRPSISVLVILIALLLGGLIAGHLLTPAEQGPPANDRAVYLRLIDDLRRGEPYYAAVVREHRLGDYPLRPFITVRPPTLAVAMAALSDAGARQLAIEVLAVAVVAAWGWRLRSALYRPFDWVLAVMAIAAATIPAFMAYGYVLHELWAGELLALSLAIHAPRRWPISVGVALVALAVRELSAPFFLAMGVLAWRDGRRGEALAWAGGLAVFVLAMAWHASRVAALVRPGDIPSPGWLALGGWKFVLLSMRWNPALLIAPNWFAAVLAPLVVLGLAGSRGPLAERLCLVVGGYAFAFLFVGRDNNAYWGLMITPLWAVALLNVRPALTDLLAGLSKPIAKTGA